MRDLLTKALSVARESKSIEFKSSFDPDSTADCCEIAKDMIALANSGGGVIVFGLSSTGTVENADLSKLLETDPADVSNKIKKYIGGRELNFVVETPVKSGKSLIAFLIEPAARPLVFEKPGTYSAGDGKQKSAFAMGTAYFRHGAKSEPANNLDIEKSFDRQLETLRKSWLSGVRRVIQAPPGSHVQVRADSRGTSTDQRTTAVRCVANASAMPVNIIRDDTKSAGATFYHESVSESLFEEINNVIQTNTMLFSGRNAFLLSTPIYYRVYAERHHVKQPQSALAQLLSTGLTEYSPFLFWSSLLPEHVLAEHLSRPGSSTTW